MSQRRIAITLVALPLVVLLVSATQPAIGQSTDNGGLTVNPTLLPPPSTEPVPQVTVAGREAAPAPTPVPTFDGTRPVYALASAMGGRINYVAAKESVGSHLDPYVRRTLPIPDMAVDAIVLRSLDKAVARRFPNTDRLHMRLNPAQLDGVPLAERDTVALERLIAELKPWPQRQQWDRIVLMTPHYRAFEGNGLGSKLSGVGMYVQNLNNNSEYDTVEPDGTPGVKQRNRYVALFYVATVYILDAKTLRVVSSEHWQFDEKVHDSNAAGLDVARAIDPDRLAARLESFVQDAAEKAATRTFGGRVEAGEIRPVPQPAK